MHTLNLRTTDAGPIPKPLLGAAALAVVIHALLLWGLPWLQPHARTLLSTGALSTRVVAPSQHPSANVSPAPPESPSLTQPPPPTKSRPKSRPRAEPPAEARAPKAGKAVPAQAEPSTPTAPQASVASSGTASDASLLGPPPPGAFGGGSTPQALQPPLPPEEAAKVVALAGTASDGEVRLPRSAELTYRSIGVVGNQPFDVATKLTWRHNDHYYEARWTLFTPKIGEQTRVSTGVTGPSGLLPVLASLRTPNAQDMRFDYESMRLFLTTPEATATLRPGAQDRLSVLLQMAAMVAGDSERYAKPGTGIDLPAVHPDRVGRWHFVVQDTLPIEALKEKMLPALHLLHEPQDPTDVRLEVWLGRTLDYLPVRLHVTEANGDTADYVVQSAYTRPVPAAASPDPSGSGVDPKVLPAQFKP